MLRNAFRSREMRSPQFARTHGTATAVHVPPVTVTDDGTDGGIGSDPSLLIDPRLN